MMTEATNIRMMDSNQEKPSAALIIALLVPLTITLTIPREYFDPHAGVDYDIYCRLYYGVAAQDPACTAIVLFFRQLTVEPIIEHKVAATISLSSRTRIIRAPPRPAV